RSAGGDVLFEPLAHEVGRSEGRALGHCWLVHTPARHEWRSGGARPGRVVVEVVVEQGAEVVDRDFAAGLLRERQNLADAHSQFRRRDEGRDPAIADPPGASYRGLALAADPEWKRTLKRLGQHGDAIE